MSRFGGESRRLLASVVLVSVIVLLGLLLSRPSALSLPETNPDFRNFESLHVHPLDLTPDGTRLLAVNTPDARLEVFAVDAGGITSIGEIPVGLDPVTVRAQNDSVAWVVNLVSDDVSVVNLNTLHVEATIRVGDEPTDVVFAGSPLKAFVCVSGEDAVKAYDVATRAPSYAPIAIAGRHPRSLATSPNGSAVYVGVLDAGNRTTILSSSQVIAGGGASPPVPAMDTSLPVAPNVAAVVQWDGAHWIDDGQPTPKTWDSQIPAGFLLADTDIATIDANSGTVTTTISDVGTSIFNIAVAPGTGTLYVTNTEAFNRIRFEPNVRGRFLENRVTLISPGGGGTVTPMHLNSHINYAVSPGPSGEIEQSLGGPTDILVNAAATKSYVAALGSGKVGVLDASGNVTNRVPVGGSPSPSGISAAAPRGPSGLALDAANGHLFVMNRFTNSISIVDVATEAKIGETPLRFDPSPPAITNGRSFLYDATRSAHGDLACASCHIGGNMDNLAWDLGDPQGQMAPNTNFPRFQPLSPFHPMKGPMTTQTLRGLLDTAPLHWRGDRADFTRFNPAFIGLMGAPDSLTTAEMNSFNSFIMTVVHGPNPNQNLDRTYAPLAEDGRVEFSAAPHFASHPCAFCHALPKGTDRLLLPGAAIGKSQDFKQAHLRNLYQKTGFERGAGSQKRGFGFSNDGAADNIVNFLRQSIFDFPDTTKRYSLQAFLLSFDTGMAPSVGREITISGSNKNATATIALLDSLYAQAEAGNCDLVAHGYVGGVIKGFLYQIGGQFISDYYPEGSISADALRSLASDGGEITYLGVPPGSGVRMGIDRDRDGYRDRWELALGSDPADPGSLPPITAVSSPPQVRVVRLDQNRPNPFNPATEIRYDSGEGGHVSLRIFDVSGRQVRTLVDATQPPGAYRTTWDGRSDGGTASASGRYFYRLQVGNVVRSATMVLLR